MSRYKIYNLSSDGWGYLLQYRDGAIYDGFGSNINWVLIDQSKIEPLLWQPHSVLFQLVLCYLCPILLEQDQK